MMRRTFDGEPPGWDNRKSLADIWQEHAPLPAQGLSDDVYHALIAVARWGFDLGVESAVDEPTPDEMRNLMGVVLRGPAGDALT